MLTMTSSSIPDVSAESRRVPSRLWPTSGLAEVLWEDRKEDCAVNYVLNAHGRSSLGNFYWRLGF